MRRLIIVLAALGALTAPAALAHGTYPEKIALPNAFAPEGIEIAFGKTFFVGSTQTGAIYAGDLRTRSRAGRHPRRRTGHDAARPASSTTAASSGSPARPAAPHASTT